MRRPATSPAASRRACRLKIPFVTYFKDPAVARANPLLDFDEDFVVDWEPGLTDGPTSARFAVVDYNADTGRLDAPAVWDEPNQAFVSRRASRSTREHASTSSVPPGQRLGRCCSAPWTSSRTPRAGPAIPWAFEGNRLIVVPHAGYGAERLLRPREQVAPVLLFDSERGHRLHLPLDRHRQPRIRACRARRHPALLQREQPVADRRLPRVHGRPHRDPAHACGTRTCASGWPRRRSGEDREGHDAGVDRRGSSARPSRAGPTCAPRSTTARCRTWPAMTSPHRLSAGHDRRHVRLLLIALGESYRSEARTTPRTSRRRTADDAQAGVLVTPPSGCSGWPSSRSTSSPRWR